MSSRPSLTFVVQEPQLGTAHALLTTESTLKSRTGTVILLSGDVPLLTRNTLQRLAQTHQEARAAATVVTATVESPRGYGRIVRSGEQIARIVEEKDATADERQIHEINAGIYAFELDGLFDAVRGIAAANAQREYYLPDLVAIFRNGGRRVETYTVPNAMEILGINSRAELAMMNRLVRETKNAELMASGVTLEDPATTYVHPEVRVGADTILHPGVSLEGRTIVGEACEIHSGARLVDAVLGDRVIVLNHSLIVDSMVGEASTIGPFAHLRGKSSVGAHAKIGNFVELKKTAFGDESKSSHLTYLGDAVIGAGVNIGAGTITCNYDGVRKHTTTIEDGAFIGSDTQLIAPVTVGEGAYVGTGTTVRENVPAGALAVSAGKQRNIEGWVKDKKTRNLQVTRNDEK
jgi:bifunctional UDP-N-acetylglucosamine pyrophosphorylase/glucosamine-1-phosphate N-acetyltransferase